METEVADEPPRGRRLYEDPLDEGVVKAGLPVKVDALFALLAELILRRLLTGVSATPFFVFASFDPLTLSVWSMLAGGDAALRFPRALEDGAMGVEAPDEDEEVMPAC